MGYLKLYFLIPCVLLYPLFICLFISNLMAQLSENILCVTWTFWDVLRAAFWTRICSILEKKYAEYTCKSKWSWFLLLPLSFLVLPPFLHSFLISLLPLSLPPSLSISFFPFLFPLGQICYLCLNLPVINIFLAGCSFSY